MQDHQQQHPILSLVPIAGEGMSVEDLEIEGLAALMRVAEEAVTSLSGTDSPKLRFFRSVQASSASLLGESGPRRVLHG